MIDAVEIVDTGGDSLIVKSDPLGIRLEGFGSRGGHRGEALLLEDEISETTSMLRAYADGGTAPLGLVMTFLASGNIRPGFFIVPNDKDDMFFLMGPRGGYRRPLHLQSKDMFVVLADAIQTIASAK